MKKNAAYIFIILILLVCEIFAQSIEGRIYHAVWTFSFRFLSIIVMWIWIYQKKKEHFYSIEKKFLISILLSALLALVFYLFVEKIAIGINICIYCIIFTLWISVFKQMGAAIKVFNSNDTTKYFVPFIFIILFVYFIVALYPNISPLYACLTFVFISLASYAGMLVLFLPSSENNRYFIILGVCLSICAHIMFSFFIFLSESYLIYPFFRAMIVVATCSMIYGMINYDKPNALNEEN